MPVIAKATAMQHEGELRQIRECRIWGSAVRIPNKKYSIRKNQYFVRRFMVKIELGNASEFQPDNQMVLVVC